MKDYYSILGVDKNASTDDIQKAFKKLALKWHPDRWISGTDEEKKIAEEKFKEISEAKDVLCDPQKRAQYDNPMQGAPNMDPDMEDFVKNFFGGRMRNNMPPKGKDYRAYATITTKEAFEGVRKKVLVEKEVECKHCNGTGSESRSNPACPHCNGTGRITQTVYRSANSFKMNQRPCPYCGGTGKLVQDPCKYCHGSGTEIVNEEIVVDIPRGVADGMTLTLNGLGGKSDYANGVNGNLILNIRISDADYFQRVDMTTIVHNDYIPFNEAITGVHKEYNCIDGTKVRVDDDSVVKDGQQYVFNGKGMPNLHDNRYVGDYVVVINYTYPNKLTDKQKQILRDLNK
jgi:molecular chaperone DnaJ